MDKARRNGGRGVKDGWTAHNKTGNGTERAKTRVGNGRRNGRDGNEERAKHKKRDGRDGNVGRRAHDATGKRTVRTEALSE